MKNYILYSTDGCHLCEQAWQLCQQLGLGEQVQVVDIVYDDSLSEQYGVHIPVLKQLSSQQQLFWPFDQQQLAEFIA